MTRRPVSADVRRVPIAGFVTVSGLAALTPLLAIPSITHHVGAVGWGAVAIGQAVGTFTMVVVTFGWSTTGSTTAALTQPGDRPSLYRESVYSRLVIAAFALPLSCVICVLIAPADHRAVVLLTCLGFGIWGLSPTWYYTGTGQASRVAAYETLPKLAAALGCVLSLQFVHSALVYGACFLGAGCISSVVSAFRIVGRLPWSPPSELRAHLQGNATLTVGRVVAGGFSTLAVPLVAGVSPSAVPLFAAAERFRSFAWMGINSVSMAFQGWIGGNGPGEPMRKRQRRALLATTGTGVIAGLGLAIGLPAVDQWIFSGEVEVPALLATVAGGTTAVVAVSISLTFHYLGPAKDGRTVLLGALAGSVIGVPAIALLAARAGARGASIGVLIAEVAVLSVLVIGARRAAGVEAERSK
jgi:O-antigen/teichoic acid export membrane protein